MYICIWIFVYTIFLSPMGGVCLVAGLHMYAHVHTIFRTCVLTCTYRISLSDRRWASNGSSLHIPASTSGGHDINFLCDVYTTRRHATSAYRVLGYYCARCCAWWVWFMMWRVVYMCEYVMVSRRQKWNSISLYQCVRKIQSGQDGWINVHMHIWVYVYTYRVGACLCMFVWVWAYACWRACVSVLQLFHGLSLFPTSWAAGISVRTIDWKWWKRSWRTTATP